MQAAESVNEAAATNKFLKSPSQIIAMLANLLWLSGRIPWKG
jgi:hypothetical protein